MNATVEMTGTEKQVAWASKIRETVYGFIETGKTNRADNAAANIAEVTAKLPEVIRAKVVGQLQSKMDATNAEKTAKIESFFGSKTSAGWWINSAPQDWTSYELRIEEILTGVSYR